MTRKLPSEADIAVLEALAAQRELLVAPAAGSQEVFRAPLLFVDPGRQFLIVASSGNEAADRALLARQQIDFFLEWGEWRIVFTTAAPAPVRHDGVAAIRLPFPESVSIGRRRMHERVSMPEDDPPRCICPAAGTSGFEAIVTDVSKGGIGMRIEGGADDLAPGAKLRGCRIERPGRNPAIVDLEVTHTVIIRLPRGGRALRVGCRFAYLSAEAMEFVAECVRAQPRAG